jgi:hypothetical protein
LRVIFQTSVGFYDEGRIEKVRASSFQEIENAMNIAFDRFIPSCAQQAVDTQV